MIYTKDNHIFYKYSQKEIKDGERNRQFYGPAINCDELGLLGYTLNGYHLVKKTTDSNKKGKIGIVYCQFQQFQGQKKSKITIIIINPLISKLHLEIRI